MIFRMKMKIVALFFTTWTFQESGAVPNDRRTAERRNMQIGNHVTQKQYASYEGNGGAKTSGNSSEKITDYRSVLQEKREEILAKIQNGNTEKTYRIGGQEFTEKEWDKLLENFDDIQEKVKELTQEEQEQREEKDKQDELLKYKWMLRR